MIVAYWLIDVYRILHASADEIICRHAKGISIENVPVTYTSFILCINCDLLLDDIILDIGNLSDGYESYALQMYH